MKKTENNYDKCGCDEMMKKKMLIEETQNKALKTNENNLILLNLNS